MTQVVTRIAPSPTGYMHIGTARTALFNWLYARGRDGKFLLRIEDTDRARSTPEATEAILGGLEWLGLDYDGTAVSQFERAPRHIEVAQHLLASGKAYKCFATQDEIADFRQQAKAEGRSTLYQSPWRDITDPALHPDVPFVIRIKSPESGLTVIHDQVQGDVNIKNDQLDDMILLRSDGTPVYMLSVVVDDHDMGVTHVIRGDDHLNNAARQMMIYQAMEWPLPIYAHIPLIFGEDGKKLSKRHGATSVLDYALMGYPAAAMRNYLARLGWSHGDDEFFTDQDALNWFDLSGIGKSPARFDQKKLQNLSGQHIAVSDDAALLQEIQYFLTLSSEIDLHQKISTRLLPAMYCLKDRAKTFPELLEKAAFILRERPIEIEKKMEKNVNISSLDMLKTLTPQLQNVSWSRDALEALTGQVAETHGVNFGKLAGPLRAALAGQSVTPSVFDMMLILGRNEAIARLSDMQERGTP